jgi:hypothetical protein
MTASWAKRSRRFLSICVISSLTALIFAACKDLGSNATLPDGHANGGAAGSSVGGESGSQGGSSSSGDGGEAGGGQGPTGGNGDAGTEPTGGRSGSSGNHQGGVGGTGADDTSGHAGMDAGGGGDDVGGGGAGGGDGVCLEDVTTRPGCGNLDLVPQSAAAGVAVVADKSSGYQLFATTASSHALAVSWGGETPSPAWAPWQCFDAVPQAERVAAGVMLDDWPEVFVTTRCGELFFRRLIVNPNTFAWSPWAPMSLPLGDSFVTDVAASVDANGINHVYVADRGNVFVRNRVGELTYDPYGPWRAIGSGTFRIVTGGLRADGRQQVFALDSEGKPKTSAQVSGTLGDSFEPWVDFGAVGLPPLVDIEAPYGTAAIEVYAIDETGSLWTRRENESGGFSAWAEWQGPEPPESLVALAAAGTPPPATPALLVVGVGSSGSVYRTRRENSAWGPWREHL